MTRLITLLLIVTMSVCQSLRTLNINRRGGGILRTIGSSAKKTSKIPQHGKTKEKEAVDSDVDALPFKMDDLVNLCKVRSHEEIDLSFVILL